MIDCRHKGKNQPRALRTHLPDCERATCEGCEPCPERHCMLCGREHVTAEGAGTDQTCTTCIGKARTTGNEIIKLTARMMAEAIIKGVNSDAAVYAGPSANVEAWTWRKLAMNKAGIDWGDIDDDPTHPSWVVGTWEMLVREHYAQTTTKQLAIDDAWKYLNGHLTRLAQDTNFAFEEMVTDLNDCLTRLEKVLREGEQEDRGAPCPMCGKGALIKDYGKTAADDIRWKCDRRGCGQWWSDDDYREKVNGTYALVADRLTATQMFQTHRIPAGTLRRWASETTRVVGGVRVTIPPKIRSVGFQNGVKLYPVADAIALRDQGSEQESA